jgi:hypothetical protein
MIPINEKTVATWHLSVVDDFDYLAALYRNESDQLMFKCRFIHADDPDTANWYTVGPPPAGQAEQEFEDIMVGTIRMMEDDLGWRADEIRMKNGDVEAFCDELLSRPYVRVRRADTNAN